MMATVGIAIASSRSKVSRPIRPRPFSSTEERPLRNGCRSAPTQKPFGLALRMARSCASSSFATAATASPSSTIARRSRLFSAVPGRSSQRTRTPCSLRSSRQASPKRTSDMVGPRADQSGRIAMIPGRRGSTYSSGRSRPRIPWEVRGPIQAPGTEVGMGIAAPERPPAHGGMSEAERAKQVRQAEELLFSGPSKEGFAKALFLGEFHAGLALPLSRAARGRARRSSTGPSPRSARSPSRASTPPPSTATPRSPSRSSTASAGSACSA